MDKIKKKRSSGILLHITSLPNRYGIGDFGDGAYRFVDFLEKAGQKNWQILPLGMTGYGASPYQCFSAFAGNPYLIALDELIEEGYLSEQDVDSYPLCEDRETVNYDLIYKNKMCLLRIAYHKSKKFLRKKLEDYYRTHSNFLRDFSLYMSLRTHYNGLSHLYWCKEHQSPHTEAIQDFEQQHSEEILFWVYTQYLFSNQWRKLKTYANAKGVRIIGDLPFYVATDSSDVWAYPHFFKLKKDGTPAFVAGCPPDFFSEEGQLWGNPIYNWKNLEKDGYHWWTERIRHSFEEVDILRIDHFRGFEAFWQIKYGSPNAVNGKWVLGPGYKFFKKINEALGKKDIIAEDLGLLTEKVYHLIRKTGYPGMRILQFAFSVNEESNYLPHHLEKNSVVYTGTHDNDTLVGWLSTMCEEDFDFAKKYMKLDEQEGYPFGVIRTAWSSPSYLAIAPMQDFLNLDSRSRMNTPSTVGGNWQWRLKEEDLTEELAKKIRELTKLYGR